MIRETLVPGALNPSQLRAIARGTIQAFTLGTDAREAVERAAASVSRIIERGTPAYGINTGFGRLAQTHIPREQLERLQRNLVLSHAVGVGAPMRAEVVRLILALKIASLGRGHSGVRLEVIETLLDLLEADLLPVIPEKGSVGASGDLAPLAHMSAALLGVGEVTAGDDRIPAADALARIGRAPLRLAAKEGLALLNGTQASTALALVALFDAQRVFESAVVAGAMAIDAAAGTAKPFDARIHELRGHRGQKEVAAAYRVLLEDSEINRSHRKCGKVQDPYSLRCQPQVMGACLTQMEQVASVLLIEANGVSDNPLIIPETDEVLSGGNFHAEPVGLAADNLALAIAEIGALSERRIALLIDESFSDLPPFLVEDGGLNSGFMIAQVTAAALASENKSLAHPASVDSLPTSANQEDHVSMATFAARRLDEMVDNSATIVGIELLAAAQGIDLRAPLTTSRRLQPVMAAVRERVPFYERDRFFAPDIETMRVAVRQGVFAGFSPHRTREGS
ncbi:MAG: histidine ammonia-lyase [Acidobacteriota bacterium]